MTTEEKAKAYDKAFERAKRMFSEKELNYLFPEFKESKEGEDERIRKAIIEGLMAAKNNFRTISSIKIDDAIAWLEKQGEQKSYNNKFTPEQASVLDKHIDKFLEQKPTNKVEPKFHEGEWIISDTVDKDYRICKITGIKDGNYTIESTCGYKGYNQFDVFDTAYKLWTIQDAKDGDVLATDDDSICIFDGTVEEGKYPFAYCGLTRYGFESYDRRLPVTHNDVHPATKEQRDALMKAMTDAGYTFDFEKKELKKIERKPTEWRDDEQNQRPQKYVGYNPYKATVESIAKMCNKYENWMCDETEAKYFLCDVSAKCHEAVEYDKKYPQKQWKPSKEQMKALYAARHGNYFDVHTLESLFYDLEQLK